MSFERELRKFGTEFSSRAVSWKSDKATWVIDARRGLSTGVMLTTAARLMIQSANRHGLEREITMGLNVMGNVLATAIGMCDRSTEMVWGPGAPDIAERHPLGIHGANFSSKTVCLVDDIVVSGGTLVSHAEVVRDVGGEVVAAQVLIDRGGGVAAQALRDMDKDIAYIAPYPPIVFNALYTFDETNGLLVPNLD